MLFLNIIRIFINWLLIASLVGVLTKRFKMPYTVGLVLIGLLFSIIIPLTRKGPTALSPEQIRTFLVPNLILTLLVPPLIFEAAFHVNFKDLRQEIKPQTTILAGQVVYEAE